MLEHLDFDEGGGTIELLAWQNYFLEIRKVPLHQPHPQQPTLTLTLTPTPTPTANPNPNPNPDPTNPNPNWKALGYRKAEAWLLTVFSAVRIPGYEHCLQATP